MNDKTLALFDFDGTLCKIDSFTGFYQFCFGTLGIMKGCHTILSDIARYYMGLYPAHLMRPLLSQQLLDGLRVSDIEITAKTYAHAVIEHQINQDVLSRLKWHKTQGHQICLVSAGLDLYLKYIADHFQIDLVCSNLCSENGILSGHYIGKDCSRDEKVKRVRKKYVLEDFSNIYAYGNSHEDYAMFRVANHVNWVDKNQKLHVFKSKH